MCEILSLYAVWLVETERAAEAQEVGDFLNDFVGRTPALSHLVGEEWAYSILVTVAALAATGHSGRAMAVVRDGAVWLLDRLENGLKIARVGASPNEVVDELVGPYLRRRAAPRDRSMYALTVVIDAAILLGDHSLASDIAHDAEIYRAMAGTYVPISVDTARRVARVHYGGDPVSAEHHGDESAGLWPVTSIFDSLAVWATCRDRHLPSVVRPLFTARLSP
jgi:hypothetical protein